MLVVVLVPLVVAGRVAAAVVVPLLLLLPVLPGGGGPGRPAELRHGQSQLQLNCGLLQRCRHTQLLIQLSRPWLCI